MNKQLILASKSPRRQELLEKCNIPFISIPADIDETLTPGIPLTEAIKELSKRKASSILQQYPDAIVLGSDTIVTINDQVLGKPHSKQDAFAMLKQLQNQTHQVITGIAILSVKRVYTGVSVSNVTFAQMTDEEIMDYINTGEPMDKAGSYGIQGQGGCYVTKIQGDYYAIMGLPLNLVYEELKNINLY